MNEKKIGIVVGIALAVLVSQGIIFAKMDKKMEAQQKNLSNLQEKVSIVEEKNKKQKQKIKSLRDSNFALNNNLEKVQSKLDNKNKKNKKLKEKKNHLKKKKNSLEEKQQDLKEENESLNESLSLKKQKEKKGQEQADLQLLSEEEPKESTQSESTQSESTQSESTQSESTQSESSGGNHQTMTMEATAYTALCDTGCTGVTRTGINLLENPNKKVIAVDPNVIPLGSKVWVEGYGHAVAGDTGGDINNSRIDLYMRDRSDALNFGRQSVEVRVYN